MIQMKGKLGVIFSNTFQVYKWQSKCDFAEPFPLAAIRAFEVAL